MKAVITGVAGFIGSTLAEKLVLDNHDITGIDNIDKYYPEAIKRQNIAAIGGGSKFRFVEGDVATIPKDIFQDVEIVFHIAGQPGVRSSWGDSFGMYVRNNIMSAQALLEHLKDVPSLKKIIYASSSSVYGDSATLPLRESATPHPRSPYGVTKLAAEHLFDAYTATMDIPVVCLRYFSVFGPRQRPDMAFHRFIKAGILHEPLPVFGDGTQTRDFTFVDDVVNATVKAALHDCPESCTVLNIGSGRRNPLFEVIDVISSITGFECGRVHQGVVNGDVRDTIADISMAEKLLGYIPQIDLADGIREQYQWMLKHGDLLGF